MFSPGAISPLVLPLAAASRWTAHVAPWLGLFALTAVMFFLFRKRWNRTSVLARCVVLSLYAHFVIAVIAYSTNLFARTPKSFGPSGREARVSIAAITPAQPSEQPPLPEIPLDAPPLLADIPPELQLAPSEKPAETSSNKEVTSQELQPADPHVQAPPLLQEMPRLPLPADDLPLPQALAALERIEAEVLPQYAKLAEAKTPEKEPIPTPPQPEPKAEPIPLRADGTPVPEVYRKRFAAHQAQEAGGPTPDSEAAIAAALEWLAAAQSTDGRWEPHRFGAGRENPDLAQHPAGTGADAATGITALALLAFMGSGETHLEGKHREHVQKGLEFLIRSQRADGSLAGEAQLFSSMYCHGMASLAIAEALALTGDRRIQPFVERAVNYSVKAQHSSGGWRYQPGDVGDTSQFGWQVLALESAKRAGIEFPESTRLGMMRYLAGVSSGKAQGLASYRKGERPNRTMTAEALVCRYLLETQPAAAVKREAAEYVMQDPPRREQSNVYYWYYGTLAMRYYGGEAWPQWNTALSQTLLQTQRAGEGPMSGSWDPDRTWGTYGGRVYQTALSALCLQAPYRYDPATAPADRIAP